jgi:hypothetical protein
MHHPQSDTHVGCKYNGKMNREACVTVGFGCEMAAYRVYLYIKMSPHLIS